MNSDGVAGRVAPPRDADERTSLEVWLEFHRATLAMKCRGLSPEQLARRAVPPSGLSLLGLVRHLAELERAYFRRGFGGEAVPWLHGIDDPRAFSARDAIRYMVADVYSNLQNTITIPVRLAGRVTYKLSSIRWWGGSRPPARRP